MPIDLSLFKETGFDETLPGSMLMPGIANEAQKRQQLQIAQELQRRMAEEQIANQPVERNYKQALIEQALAQAKRSNLMNAQDNEMRYADKIAKAEAEKILQKKRDARGMLEGVMSRYDIPGMESGPELNNLIASGVLPESATRFLRSPDGKSSFFTKEALQGAIEHLGQGDPLYMGQRKVETQQQGATSRNDATIASREREGEANRDLKRELARQKFQFDSDLRTMGQSMDKLMATYMEKMRGATDPEEYAYWRGLVEYATTQLAQRNPAASVNDINLQKFSQGQIPTQPRVAPVEPPRTAAQKPKVSAADF